MFINIFIRLMCDLPIEECWVLLLNQASKVIDRIKISSGGLASTAVDVRCVLREALLKRAVAWHFVTTILPAVCDLVQRMIG